MVSGGEQSLFWLNVMCGARSVTRLVHKVDCQVKLGQGLTPLQVLDASDVVDCKVQIVELLQSMS